MRACFGTWMCTAICSATLLAGCSLTSFDDFRFGSSDGGAADSGGVAGNDSAGRTGGSGRTGGAGNNAQSGRGAGGGNAGTTGAGRSAQSGSSGGGRGAISGTGGTGGTAGMVPPPCMNDSDCTDEAAFQCVLQVCVLRRVPSGVWLSGGGGITQSGNYVLRVSAGAPQPMGIVNSNSYSVTVGAGAGRP